MRPSIVHCVVVIWAVSSGLIKAQTFEVNTNRMVAAAFDTPPAVGISMLNRFLATIDDCEPCKAKCYGALGRLYCDDKQYSQGYYWMKKAIELRRQQGDSLTVAGNFLNFSNAKHEEGRYNEAIENALISLRILEEQQRLKNPKIIADTLVAINLANVYNTLSNIHDGFGNPHEGLRYARQNLALQQTIGNRRDWHEACYTLANRYFSLYENTVTTTAVYADSAALLYRLYLRYTNERPEETEPLDVAYTHHNLASLAIRQKDYDTARREIDLAERAYRAEAADAGMVDVAILKASAFIGDRKDYRSALATMRTAQDLMLQTPVDTFVQLEVYNLLSDCFEALEQPDSALFYSREAERLYTRMFTSQQKRFNETERAHLEKRSELERNVSRLEISKGRARQRLFALAAAILALLATIGALIWRQREQRQQQRIARQNSAIEDTLKDAQVRFLQGIIEGQQIERQETKHILHNDIANSVLTLSYDIENTKPAHPQQKKWIADLRQLAAHTRRLSHQKGGIIHDIGLYDGINDLLRRIRQGNQMEVEFITNLDQKRLDTTVEVELWHIVQELVSNTLKYAHASRIELAIETDDTATYFTYNDNGDGFDYNQALKQEKSMGLHSIIEKTQALGGPTPQIISSPGHGLTVSIEIPHAKSSLS